MMDAKIIGGTTRVGLFVLDETRKGDRVWNNEKLNVARNGGVSCPDKETDGSWVTHCCQICMSKNRWWLHGLDSRQTEMQQNSFGYATTHFDYV